jgi:hypothetical protein
MALNQDNVSEWSLKEIKSQLLIGLFCYGRCMTNLNKTIQDDYLFYRDLKLDNMVLENNGKVKITGN